MLLVLNKDQNSIRLKLAVSPFSGVDHGRKSADIDVNSSIFAVEINLKVLILPKLDLRNHSLFLYIIWKVEVSALT